LKKVLARLNNELGWGNENQKGVGGGKRGAKRWAAAGGVFASTRKRKVGNKRGGGGDELSSTGKTRYLKKTSGKPKKKTPARGGLERGGFYGKNRIPRAAKKIP